MRACSDNTKAKNMPSALHACILSCCSTLLPLYFCKYQWGRKKFIYLQRAVFMFHESVLLLSSVAGPIIGKTWQSADSYFLPSVALTSPHAAALTIWRIRPWPETFLSFQHGGAGSRAKEGGGWSYQWETREDCWGGGNHVGRKAHL